VDRRRLANAEIHIAERRDKGGGVDADHVICRQIRRPDYRERVIRRQDRQARGLRRVDDQCRPDRRRDRPMWMLIRCNCRLARHDMV
jgi:hypothetical protein